MPEVNIPLPKLSYDQANDLVTLTDENGTSITVEGDELLFDHDDLEEIKDVIWRWLWKNGLDLPKQLFHPSQAALLAQYNAQAMLPIRRRNP